MPIEFHCQNCNRLLRTPDETAGKKAKCPQCESIVAIPLASAPGPLASPPGPLTSTPGPLSSTPGLNGIDSGGEKPSEQPADNANPFSESASLEESSPFSSTSLPGQTANPYASPGGYTPEFTSQSSSIGGLQHVQVPFRELWETAWETFSKHIGPCLLLGLIVIGFSIGFQIVIGVLNLIVQAVGEQILIIGWAIIVQVLNFAFQTWIQLGTILFLIHLIRRGEASFNVFFSQGPFFLAGLLANFLLTLITYGALAVALIPAGAAFAAGEQEVALGAMLIGLGVGMIFVVYFSMKFYLALVFVADQKLNGIEALKASSRFMQGNKATLFLAVFAIGFLTIFVVLFTCGIGVIAMIPYMGVMSVVMYLLATGLQPAPRQYAPIIRPPEGY